MLPSHFFHLNVPSILNNHLLSAASDARFQVEHNLLCLVKSPTIRQKSLQYTSHATHTPHCQVWWSIGFEVEGAKHAVHATLLLLPLLLVALFPVVNTASWRYLVSRHSCGEFFPKVVETLVVARQCDVPPDGLRVKALSKVELSISDEGEVGSKFITGDSVKLAYHRCKWGSSSHLSRSVKRGCFTKYRELLTNCFSFQNQLTDCSRTPNSWIASSDKKFSLMSAPEGLTGNWCKPTTYNQIRCTSRYWDLTVCSGTINNIHRTGLHRKLVRNFDG